MTDIVLSRYARRVLDHATHIARRLQHPVIEPVHILLALTQETDGMASQILSESAIDSDALFEFLQQQPIQSPADDDAAYKLPVSHKSERMLSAATDNARMFNQSTISTTHLLQAILQNPDPMVRAFFARKGLSPQTIYDDTLLILAHRAEDSEDTERKVLYSDEVLDVLTLASTQASCAKRIYIEPEHLLLALLQLPWQGTHLIFQHQGVSINQITHAIQQLHGKRKQNKMGNPPVQSHNTRLVLQAAENIACQAKRPVRAYDIFYALMQPRFPLQSLWRYLNIDLNLLERDLMKYGIVWQKPPSILQQFRDFPREIWFWFGFPLRILQHFFKRTQRTEND